MKQQISAPNTVPTANIAVNKSRLKVYKNTGSMPTYYLQKGQEFQIELANPTTDVILAKIILNGKPISQGGLVLNPGQRVFLDRYLDVAKKFLFDTYEVSGSDEMKAAIANNGDFKVEFYRERTPYQNPYLYEPFWTNNLGTYNGGSGTPTDFLRSGNGNINLSLQSSNATYSANLGDTTNKQNCVSTYTSSEPTLDWITDAIKSSPAVNDSKLRTRSLAKKSIETGRVEKGSDSKQEIKYVDKSFEYTAFHTIEYKMLPESQKINTIADISVRVYCTNCGAKLGKTDKFCGKCGKKA